MDSNSALISKVLRVTIASFFVANLMTLLGSVIDGFVVGNTMDRRDFWWMMPESFGTAPENELRAVISAKEEVMEFSEKAWEFCKDFDPRKKYETFFRNGEVDRMIGIRMIMAEAKDVSYTTMLDLNNLIICIAR